MTRKNLFSGIRKEIKKDQRIVSHLPIKVWDHLIGDRFPHHHKMSVGVFVLIVSYMLHSTTHGLLVVKDVAVILERLLDGAGVTPFLEYGTKKLKN